jgi:hypothetical protein
MKKLSGFILPYGEPVGTKVHSCISLLFPTQSEISGQPIILLVSYFHNDILLGLSFDPEDGGNMFL